MVPAINLLLDFCVSISKPPVPIIMIDQSETGRNTQIIFIILFSERCPALLPFTSLNKLCKNVGPTPFSDPNWHVLTFLHPIFNVRGHILRTTRVAVSSSLFPFLRFIGRTRHK